LLLPPGWGLPTANSARVAARAPAVCTTATTDAAATFTASAPAVCAAEPAPTIVPTCAAAAHCAA